MLTLTFKTGHDCTFSAFDSGKLKYFLNLERLTRVKHDNLTDIHPWNKTEDTLSHIKANCPGPFDTILYYKPNVDPALHESILRLGLVKDINHIKWVRKHHHIYHAALGYVNSKFEKALVFVTDRRGAYTKDRTREVESIYLFHSNLKYKLLDLRVVKNDLLTPYTTKINGVTVNVNSLHSICSIYDTGQYLIQENGFEAGKVMGLSSYGKRKDFKTFFVNGTPNHDLFYFYTVIREDGEHVLNLHKFFRPEHVGSVKIDNYQKYADYALQLQIQTQEEMLRRIDQYVEKTGISNIVISGGYGMNVVANGFYIKSRPHLNFFFEPLADDTGLSMGMGYLLHRKFFRDFDPPTHTFFHGVEEPEEKLYGVGKKCTIEQVAELILNQKIVAVFKGRAEGGARALGHRSILFDARNKDAKHIVNRVKRREWYRPFAAMVLEEDFNVYFDSYGTSRSETMTVAFDVKRPQEIPGVTHVDNTCRVQTVNHTLPHMFDLLNKVKNKTGVPVLLNTSFNLAGEPLVDTLDQALLTFRATTIDALWLPDVGRILVKS